MRMAIAPTRNQYAETVSATTSSGTSGIRGSHALDDHGDPLAAADAHRDQAVALAGAMQFVHRLDRQDAPGGSDRVAQGDGAAVRIDLRGVEPEVLADAQRLGRERLVGLDDVDLGDREAGLGERAADRAHWAEAHDLRVDAGVAVRDQ